MKDPIALFSAEWLVDALRHAGGGDHPPPGRLRRQPDRRRLGEVPVPGARRPGGADGRAARAVPRRDRRRHARPSPIRSRSASCSGGRCTTTSACCAATIPTGSSCATRTCRRTRSPGFEAIYARLGLGFGPEVAARIETMSGGDGGLAALSIFGTRRRTVRDSRAAASYFRKRLTEAQIARIRDAATTSGRSSTVPRTGEPACGLADGALTRSAQAQACARVEIGLPGAHLAGAPAEAEGRRAAPPLGFGARLPGWRGTRLPPGGQSRADFATGQNRRDACAGAAPRVTKLDARLTDRKSPFYINNIALVARVRQAA